MPIGSPLDLGKMEPELERLALITGRASTTADQQSLVQWIERYRAVKDYAGVRTFQTDLLRELQTREEEKRRRQAEWAARGIAARDHDLGQLRQHPELADFESLRRTIRALRQVGDALAWRFVRHDRLYLLAAARGRRTGAIPTGPGLDQELADFNAFWDAGHPALLHSLTTCMRWGDMTVVVPDENLIIPHESTAGPAKNRRKQRQRRDDFARKQWLMTGITLVSGEPRRHVPLNIPFEHRLDALLEASAAALEHGAACEALGTWGAVHAISLEALSQHPVDEARALADAAGARRVEITGRQERCVIGFSHERQQLEHRGVPYAAFPFPPEVVARLLTNRLILITEINLDRVVDEFRFVAQATEVCLPAADDGSWFRIRFHNGFRAAFRDFECVRVLYEAMHPRTLVTASLEFAKIVPPAGSRMHATFAFKDELDVWQ